MITETAGAQLIDRFTTGGVRTIIVMATCLSALALLSCAGLKRPPEPRFDAAIEPLDPVSGDWQGSYVSDDGLTGPVVAQVIAHGNGKYLAHILPEFDKRYSSVAGLEGRRSGDAVQFNGEINPINWGEYGHLFIKGQIKGETFAGSYTGDAVGTFEMQKVERLSPTLGQEPPEGAVVLFDGTSFDEWVHPVRPEGETGGAYQTKPATWKLLVAEGAMEVAPGTPDIVSRQKFTDFELHVEFRTPFLPTVIGQDRGNSGVYLQGRYEVQVLDSYGLEGLDNECGGIYEVGAPLVNMCAPPLQWQTYDMTFFAPRFDDGGNKAENVRITVLHNGIKIHDNLEIPGLTGSADDLIDDYVNQPGGIALQVHPGRVQYRNIWLVELP